MDNGDGIAPPRRPRCYRCNRIIYRDFYDWWCIACGIVYYPKPNIKPLPEKERVRKPRRRKVRREELKFFFKDDIGDRRD